MLVRNYPPGVELEDRSCPVGCARADTVVVTGRDRLHGIPGEFDIVRCGHCGLMRTNPRPTPQTMGIYYPDDYGPYKAEGPPPKLAAGGDVGFVRRLLGFQSRRLPPIKPGRLLEIGCASGAFLEAARAAGWQAQGIEFAEGAAKDARAKGFDVQVSSLEGARAPDERFDVVAAWMVLEHLHEPIDGLKRIASWLADDGYLVASVPVQSGRALRAFGDANYDLHLPNHLFHFDPSTLSRLLHLAGLRIEKIVWQRNPNTLLWTLEYRATDAGRQGRARMYKALRESPRFKLPRLALAILLGMTRTSGRIEFWARRANAPRPTAG